MMPEDTLRLWVRNEVVTVLKRKVVPPPLVLWCDTEGAWRDLLRAAAEGGAFELWSDGGHELVLRERLLTSQLAPRVVWLPVAADEIGYLKVFELQAEQVWTETLVSALARFGVEIARDHEAELRHLLPAHAKEWIDRPRSAWRELTPGNAKSTLVDDDLVLTALAKRGIALSDLVGGDRLNVFVRRVTEDFGCRRRRRPRTTIGAWRQWHDCWLPKPPSVCRPNRRAKGIGSSRPDLRGAVRSSSSSDGRRTSS